MASKQPDKARHLPIKGKFIFGLLISIGILLSFVAGLTFLVLLFVTREKIYGIWFLAAMAAWTLCIIFRYVYSSSCRCPLCHGPWMEKKRCHMHEKARKHMAFNYRTSMMLDAVFNRWFRCPYCGTAFRMWK